MKIYYTIIFWLVTMCVKAQVTSQNYFEEYLELISSSENVLDQKEAVQRFIDACIAEASYKEAAKIAGDYCYESYINGSLEQAIAFSKDEVTYYKKLPSKDEAYIKATYRLGALLQSNNQSILAVPYLKEAISVKPVTMLSGYAYESLAKYYKDTGDFEKSEDAYLRAIQVLRDFENHSQVITRSIDLARLYETSNLPKAQQKNKAVLDQLYKEYAPFEGQHYLRYYTALGNYYNYGTIDTLGARQSFHKVLKAAQGLDNKTQEHNAYSNLSFLYLNVKSDSALFYLRKARETSAIPIDFYTNDINFSQYYYTIGDLDKALTSIHTALEQQLDTTFHQLDIPREYILSKQLKRDYLIQAIAIKASILATIGYANDDHKTVQLALEHFEIADEILDYLSEESTYTNSKLAVREKASSIYPAAIKASAYLKDFEKAAYFAEKNKAVILLNNLQSSEQLRNIPSPLYNREQMLKSAITTSRTSFETAADSAQGEAQHHYLDAKESYVRYVDSLQDAEILKINPTLERIVSLEVIQQSLKDDQAILSYTWDTENIYVPEPQLLYIDARNVMHISLINGKRIDSLIEKFRKALEYPFFNKNDVDSFSKTGFDLYNIIVPEELRSQIKAKKLIVIPDGDLQFIPFDALNTSPKELRYLIEDHDISYVYSSSFWSNMSTLSRKRVHNKSNSISIAPISFSYDSLPDLKNSGKEIQNVAQVLGGASLVGEKATKEASLLAFKNANILHLATHAESSGRPWIAFKDEKLNEAELYNLQINPSLVVLSACETATGEEARGEGVMNLARGFFASGAQSVISTLWSVNDKSGSIIMQNFYEELDSGKSKSEALRLAKIHYIESHSLSDASPYYWAPYTLTGDFTSLETAAFFSNYSWLLVAILVSVFLLIIFFFKKKKLFMGNM